MLKAKRSLPTYSDGVLGVYLEKPLETTFGAPSKALCMDDLDLVVTLAYYECSIREQDVEFAARMSFALDIKVRTHRLDVVNPECKVVIDDQLYDIGSIDRSGREMYLYLGGGRRIA